MRGRNSFLQACSVALFAGSTCAHGSEVDRGAHVDRTHQHAEHGDKRHAHAGAEDHKADRVVHVFGGIYSSVGKLFHNGHANFKRDSGAQQAAVKMAAHVSKACASCSLHIVHNQEYALTYVPNATLHYVHYNATEKPFESPHNFRHRALIQVLPGMAMRRRDCAMAIDFDIWILRDLLPLCDEMHATGRIVVGSDDCKLRGHPSWIYWMDAMVNQNQSRVPAEAREALHNAERSLNAGILGATASSFLPLEVAIYDEIKSYNLAFSDMMAVWWLVTQKSSRYDVLTGWPGGNVNGPYYNHLCAQKCLSDEEMASFYLAHKYDPAYIKRCKLVHPATLPGAPPAKGQM